MIILSLFTNILFYYFPDELAIFHTMMSWACSRRVGGRASPYSYYYYYYYYYNYIFFQMSWSLTK